MKRKNNLWLCWLFKKSYKSYMLEMVLIQLSNEMDYMRDEILELLENNRHKEAHFRKFGDRRSEQTQ